MERKGVGHAGRKGVRQGGAVLIVKKCVDSIFLIILLIVLIVNSLGNLRLAISK